MFGMILQNISARAIVKKEKKIHCINKLVSNNEETLYNK